VEDIKIRRLGWAGHIIRREDPKKGVKRNLPQHKTSGKTTNQIGRSGSEGRITADRSERMEEKSRKQGRMEARCEGGQCPEGAVAPYMDGWTIVVTKTMMNMMMMIIIIINLLFNEEQKNVELCYCP
jgi:hypothetical protein